MLYEVTGKKRKINFGAYGVDEILQNVAMILTTPKHSVPLRRDWFIDYTLQDIPIDAAKARLAADIFSALRRHEPRAKIVGEIKFLETDVQAMDGYLIPSVTVDIPEPS